VRGSRLKLPFSSAWTAIGIICAVVYASFFEWTLHRCVMHRLVGKFRYPLESHTSVHHRIFRADETYHLIDKKDAKTIPMAWWNGPVLIIIGLTPFAFTSWQSGHWSPLCGAAAACAAYYGACEYIHCCMHLPKKRQAERSGISSDSTAITCCFTVTWPRTSMWCCRWRI
jgi:hypothetical protein